MFELIVGLMIIVVWGYCANYKKIERSEDLKKRNEEHQKLASEQWIKATILKQYRGNVLTRQQILDYQEEGLLDKNLKIEDWIK